MQHIAQNAMLGFLRDVGTKNAPTVPTAHHTTPMLEKWTGLLSWMKSLRTILSNFLGKRTGE